MAYSLDDAVCGSSNNDTIILPTGSVKVSNVIVIDHNLTIMGSGLTFLDVNTMGGCFVAPNCTLNLNNISVSNNVLSHSLIINKGKLSLNNCLFENNKGNVNGLIINNLFNSSFMINNTNFTNNDAGDISYGGVINMNYSAGVNNINNSIFKNNHGCLGGVGYIDLYDNACLNVMNSLFENNSGYKGGVFYNKDSSLYLKDSKFTGNNVNDKGGVVYNDNSDDFRILGCDFTDNSALMGGVVYATTAVSSVGHSNFTNNHARSGGAIYNNDGGKQVYVYNRTVFSGNGWDSAGSYGGAITVNNGDLVLTRSTLNNNSAEIGGAVYSKLGECSFSDCSFSDNHLKTVNGLSYGGAVYSENSRLSIKGTVFNRCMANIGGAVYSDEGSLVAVDGYETSFMSNVANRDGGAIFSLGDLKASGDVDFVDNNATMGSGGAIYSCHGLLVDEVNFEFNHAKCNGGAIKAAGSTCIRILSSNFTDNVANQSGDGLYLYEGSYALVNNSVFNNSLFYNARSSHVLVNSTIFNNNGYCIFHESGNNLTLRGVSMNKGNATMDGISCPNSFYRGQIHIQ